LNPEQEKSQVFALASEVYNAGLLTGDAVAATIAHEVKQPLSGMITNADAGLRWLDHSTPNVDKAKAAFEQIVADGHRAAAGRNWRRNPVIPRNPEDGRLLRRFANLS
jgi:C4-dicarboxylate-specific signal transduction histidine kinase